jgi:hypothetical protein
LTKVENVIDLANLNEIGDEKENIKQRNPTYIKEQYKNEKKDNYIVEFLNKGNTESISNQETGNHNMRRGESWI